MTKPTTTQPWLSILKRASNLTAQTTLVTLYVTSLTLIHLLSLVGILGFFLLWVVFLR
jgi:hypothetical protein